MIVCQIFNTWCNFKAPEWIFLFRLQKFPMQLVHKKIFPRKSVKNDRINLWTRTPWGQYPGKYSIDMKN